MPTSSAATEGLDAAPNVDPRRQPLSAEGKSYLIRDHMAALIQLALALGTARTIGWLNAWLYVALLLGVKLGSALVLTRMNPAVLNARGTKRAMNKRERLFFSVFIPSTLAIPIIAGVTAGAPGWSHRSVLELAVGIGLLIAGATLVIWALAVNAFFEPTVRLQRDRGQRVCTSGPYRVIRHPGYAGAIVASAGVPLILGSPWALLPVVVMTVAFVVRIRYEDALLQEELDGYVDYAKGTRFRLLPYVW